MSDTIVDFKSNNTYSSCEFPHKFVNMNIVLSRDDSKGQSKMIELEALSGKIINSKFGIILQVKLSNTTESFEIPKKFNIIIYPHKCEDAEKGYVYIAYIMRSDNTLIMNKTYLLTEFHYSISMDEFIIYMLSHNETDMFRVTNTDINTFF